jgi:peptidoglycan/LPS O-acetylase OafA/YrhL
LTGLRGIAAAWVFAHHLFEDASGSAWMVGYLGVDLFFVLSGFVLSYVYADGKLRTLVDWKKFIGARIARVYPLHVVTLLSLAALVWLWPGYASSYPAQDERFGIEAFVANLLLVQNWAHFLPTSWNTPAWSLSAEWAAYLSFPIFLLVARRLREPLVASFVCMSALLLAMWACGAPFNSQGTPGMLRMAFSIMAGCLLLQAYVAKEVLPARSAALISLGLIGAAHLPGMAGVGVLAFPAIVLLAAQSDGPIARLCKWRPAVWLGDVSYSLYLWHWIVIQIASRTLSLEALGAAWYVIVIVMVLLLSWASARFIERPARDWGRRLSLR